MDHGQAFLAKWLEDEAFARGWMQTVNSEWVSRAFAARYGRGWQKKLAKALGIAESTLSGWLRADPLPSWAKLSIAALVLRDDEALPVAWMPVRTERGSYQVVSADEPVGRVVADSIQTEDEARLLAAAPALRAALEDAGILADAYGDQPGFESVIEKIERAWSLLPEALQPNVAESA